MTHSDIYTKFMIEYDKANITSSYPSLTKYEVATILDKAYLALIAQILIGNNPRKASFEVDIKAIEDLRPLIKTVNLSKLSTNNTIVANNESLYRLPSDLLYYIQSQTHCVNDLNAIDKKKHYNQTTQLINHDIADKFRSTKTNLPWIKNPTVFLQENNAHLLTDPFVYDNNNIQLITTYIKKPAKFALSAPTIGNNFPIDPSNPEAIVYNVTVSFYNETKGVLNHSVGEYSEGDEITLNCENETDYVFDHWEITTKSGSYITTNEQYKLIVDGDITAVAYFNDVYVEATPGGDDKEDVNPDTGEVVTTTYEYIFPTKLKAGPFDANTTSASIPVEIGRKTLVNGEVVFTKNNYAVIPVQVRFDANTTTTYVTRRGTVSYTFNESKYNVDWEVQLKPIEIVEEKPTTTYYTVAVISDDSTMGAVTTTTEGSVIKDTKITVSAIPNVGYTFIGWYINQSCVSTNVNYQFTVTKDVTIVAKFNKTVEQYHVKIYNNIVYTVTGATSGYYESGTNLKLNCTPNAEGYVFEYWTVFNSNDSSVNYYYTEQLSINVNSDLTISPAFKLKPSDETIYSVTFAEDYKDKFNISTSIDPSVTSSEKRGTYKNGVYRIYIKKNNDYNITSIDCLSSDENVTITEYEYNEAMNDYTYSFFVKGDTVVTINYTPVKRKIAAIVKNNVIDSTDVTYTGEYNDNVIHKIILQDVYKNCGQIYEAKVPSWISGIWLDDSKDGMYTFNFGYKWNKGEYREGSIVFKGTEGGECVINLRQHADPKYISSEPNIIDFNWPTKDEDGEDLYPEISKTAELDASQSLTFDKFGVLGDITITSSDWISASIINYGGLELLQFVVQPNNTGSSRKGFITLTSASTGASDTIYVPQKG